MDIIIIVSWKHKNPIIALNHGCGIFLTEANSAPIIFASYSELLETKLINLAH